MKLKNEKAMSTILLVSALQFGLALPRYSYSAAPQEPTATKSPKTEAQQTFATLKEAVDALIKAAGDYDVPALLRILGPVSEDFISSADPVRDKKIGLEFAELARKKHSLKAEPSNPNREILNVGDDDWPLPIPLVKKNGRWTFDSAAGRREILYRRIGSNELDAIQICRGYVAAQEEYASQIHDNSGLNQYAQQIMSTSGKHDGLYWKNPDGSSGGPISEAVARALSEGYSADKRSAYHGYYFKILKGQGPAAPLGKIDYVIQGVMIGGFALLAFPAEYRVTGVKTFMVSQQGVVYQKDLGPETIEIAASDNRRYHSLFPSSWIGCGMAIYRSVSSYRFDTVCLSTPLAKLGMRTGYSVDTAEDGTLALLWQPAQIEKSRTSDEHL
jgi:hypothetical protein